jgi:hypothetical protein
MQVTIYHRPNGRPEVLDIPNVHAEDAVWFKANNVKVSMEEDGGAGFIVYGDIGRKDEDGEPDEVLVLSGGLNCQDTLAKLRKECEEALK